MAQMVNFEYGNGTLCAAQTATALGTLANVERYNRICFSITGLATETVGVVPSFDYSSVGALGAFETVPMRPIDCATGALAAASALGNGLYMFVNTPWKALKFTKSAGVDSATIRYAVLNAN